MLVAFWLIMAIIVAMVANSKNRSWFPWFLYGLVIWPIALVHALIVTKENLSQSNGKPSNKTCPNCGAILKGTYTWCRYCNTSISEDIVIPEERECPFCAELIKVKAVKCKHCGSDVGAHRTNDKSCEVALDGDTSKPEYVCSRCYNKKDNPSWCKHCKTDTENFNSISKKGE